GVHDRPAEHDLTAESDLVRGLQVTETVRVAVLDLLDADVALHAPTDLTEVTDDGLHVRVDRLVRTISDGRLRRRNGVGHRRAQTLEVRDVHTEPELGVLLAAIRVPVGRERPRVR